MAPRGHASSPWAYPCTGPQDYTLSSSGYGAGLRDNEANRVRPATSGSAPPAPHWTSLVSPMAPDHSGGVPFASNRCVDRENPVGQRSYDGGEPSSGRVNAAAGKPCPASGGGRADDAHTSRSPHEAQGSLMPQKQMADPRVDAVAAPCPESALGPASARRGWDTTAPSHSHSPCAAPTTSGNQDRDATAIYQSPGRGRYERDATATYQSPGRGRPEPKSNPPTPSIMAVGAANNTYKANAPGAPGEAGYSGALAETMYLSGGTTNDRAGQGHSCGCPQGGPRGAGGSGALADMGFSGGFGETYMQGGGGTTNNNQGYPSQERPSQLMSNFDGALGESYLPEGTQEGMAMTSQEKTAGGSEKRGYEESTRGEVSPCGIDETAQALLCDSCINKRLKSEKIEAAKREKEEDRQRRLKMCEAMEQAQKTLECVRAVQQKVLQETADKNTEVIRKNEYARKAERFQKAGQEDHVHKGPASMSFIDRKHMIMDEAALQRQYKETLDMQRTVDKTG
ncbi:hypothetical protein CBR_g22454 [Chara braunii]|uniref:Uncharacterized protein n=1 Tax=Chara braunii TaxID=69332 RepID=A0A388L2L9_CHABU|nr:hypothetical protein CBR_g22454 [Chara braunii]|eukprot:GBG76574.1 hypothetical protein CBR_g22454 [Chara braunii]